MSSERLPQLPSTPLTLPDLGASMFNLAPHAKYLLITNLLTKTRVPKMIRALYTRGLVVGEFLDSDIMADYLIKDLMLRVSEEGHDRVKEFETIFKWQLDNFKHQEQKEKPRI